MNTEWTDAQLDAFWKAQKQGLALPPRMSAQETEGRPQLVISQPPSRAIWTRKPELHRGRFWSKIIILG